MTRRCDQCGAPLRAYACSPKWCSARLRWSDTDRRKRPAAESVLVREVLARFPGAEIIDVRERSAADV